MAKKSTGKIIGYEITVPGNPDFCGVDAGGVQFSYGRAQILPGRMAEWFREHAGYEVKEIREDSPETGDTDGGEAE